MKYRAKYRQTLEDVYQRLDILQPDEFGCIEWPGLTPGHYYQVSISRKGFYIHRIALERKLGRPIQLNHQAAHTCDYKSCVNPDHLYEATDKQNKHDIKQRQPEVWASRLNDLATWAKSPEGRLQSEIQGLRNKGSVPWNKRY